MSRPSLLFAALVSALSAAPAGAAPTTPARISVEVRGSGPDVILIPGLSASRGVWNGTVAAMPGYRYHLIQVAGFAGTPAAVRPLAKLIGREMEGADRFRRDLKSLVGRFGDSRWLESRSDAGVVGRSLAELISTDLGPELPRIRAPLTVIYACPARVSYACAPVSRAYASAYSRRPGTKLVRIERSGHTIMWDQPTAFQAALRAFLAER